MSTPIVRIQTCCHHPSLAYGNLLVFRTIRVGFPSARIEVVDSGSHEDTVDQIRAAAESVGASFEAHPFCHHSDYWAFNLLRHRWPQPDAPVVFVDSDTVWWENCESWDFGEALLAGRLIPERLLPPNTTMHARLHPSVVWMPSIPRLRIELARRCKPDEVIIGPRTLATAGSRSVWLTLAPLYALLKDRCTAFDEKHLNGYDHLTYGSNLPSIGMALDSGADVRSEAHLAAAAGDLEKLRGLWRRQQLELETADPRLTVRKEPFAAARQLAALQGLDLDDANLRSGVALMQAKVLAGTRDMVA